MGVPRARGLVVMTRLLQSRDRRFDSDRAHFLRDAGVAVAAKPFIQFARQL